MKDKKSSLIAMAIILAILIAGGSFYGGVLYGKSKKFSSNGPEFRGFNGQGPQLGQGMGTRGGQKNGADITMGEIMNKDAQSLTLKMRDGGSKIILFSDSTKITKSADASIGDLNVNDNIMVNGKTNQDGSITAENIQLQNLRLFSTSTPPVQNQQ